MEKVEVSFHPCGAAVTLKYVVIVLFNADQVLLVRHHLRTTWEIPGGHLELGETPMLPNVSCGKKPASPRPI
mgnify:CR=1 FL=1